MIEYQQVCSCVGVQVRLCGHMGRYSSAVVSGQVCACAHVQVCSWSYSITGDSDGHGSPVPSLTRGSRASSCPRPTSLAGLDLS